MSTATSLNLRAVLKTAISRSGMDVPARAVSGLTDSAKALFVAGAAQAQPGGVVLYIVPSDGDLEQTCADVSFFLAALEGLTPTATERAVLTFPSHEVDPYRGLAPHMGVTSVRARALYSVARGTARVVIASAAAVLPRVTAPERMLAASIDLRPGQEIAPTDLSELLIDAGFTREDPADEQGEFAVRGGIVDIFPAGEAHPVRLEFIGDTIETLRTYDPSTQRSIAPIDQIAIVPLRDILATSRSVANPESRIPNRDKDQWKANPESQIPNPDKDQWKANPESRIPTPDKDQWKANPESRIPNPDEDQWKANPESQIPNPDKDQWKANPESLIPNPDKDRSATLFDYLSRAKA